MAAPAESAFPEPRPSTSAATAIDDAPACGSISGSRKALASVMLPPSPQSASCCAAQAKNSSSSPGQTSRRWRTAGGSSMLSQRSTRDDWSAGIQAVGCGSTGSGRGGS